MVFKANSLGKFDNLQDLYKNKLIKAFAKENDLVYFYKK